MNVSCADGWRLAVLAVCLTTITGCGRGHDSVAAANGAGPTLGAAEVRELLAGLPEGTRKSLQEDRAALERVIRAELLRRTVMSEAREAKFDSDLEVTRQLDRVREEAMVRLWVAKQAKVADNYPTEADLKLAYQTNTEALTPPAQLRVAQIFIAAPNGLSADRFAVAMRKAADVGSRIPNGDFSALARDFSEHADSAARGGDVGLLPANQMLPEIVAAVRDLEVGATTGPVKTSQGLHYVKLLERKVAPVPSFEGSREQLRTALRARRAQELEQAYLAELNAKLNVAVDQIALAEFAADPKTPGRK